MGKVAGTAFGRKYTRNWQRFVLFLMEYAARFLQRQSRERALRWGERLGRFAYLVTKHLAQRSQRYARRNLRITRMPHPSATAAEQDAFLQRVFIHFSKSLVDFLRGPLLTPESLSQMVTSDGWHYVQNALAAGRGIIFVTAHLGNWEMLGRWIAAQGVALTVVAREPENPEFAAYVHRMRESAGLGVAYRGESARELLRLLKSNRAIGLLPDQNSGDVFVPFFGIPTGTAVGPAALALYTGAALIPSYCVRLPDDSYRLLFLPPIDTHPTRDKEADQRRIMATVNQVLESVIREYPDQWLWLHNRWKSAFEEGNRNRAWPDGLNEDIWRRWQGETAATPSNG